jgi:competence protein ComEC
VKDPLVVPALCFAGGIVAAHVATLSRAELGVLFGAAMLAWAYGHWRHRILLKRLGLALGFAALGLGRVAWRPVPAVALTPSPDGMLRGCVVETPLRRGSLLQFTLESEGGSRVRLSWPDPSRGPRPEAPPFGRLVTVAARLRPIRSFRNPGSFDSELWYARRGVQWFGTVHQTEPAVVEPGYCQPLATRLIADWRSRALAAVDSLYPGDGYRSAMLRGLLLGDKSGIRKAWIDDFRRSGTYHALVISGSHITLVCCIFLIWLRWFGYGTRTVLVASALTAWLYAVVAGADPPVLRAAAGFSLYVVARLFHRRARVLNLLAAVTLAFLLVDPNQLFDASFQLSFLSVAAIGAFLPRPASGPIPAPAVMASRLERRLIVETLHLVARLSLASARRLVDSICWAFGALWSLFRVSFAVQVGLALPMVLLFHRVSISGLSANLVVVPILSAAIPFGFLAIFTRWHWVAWLAGWLLDRSEDMAAWHARLEPLWRVAAPPVWLGALFTVALLACAFPLARRWRWPAVALCAVTLALIVVHPFPPDAAPGTLELAAVDVGQGESLLLALPDSQFVLVDTGGLPVFGRAAASDFDIGEEVVSPYLWTRGVRRLAALALTHLHDDHAGSAEALMENFRPRELWTGFTPDTPRWRSIEKRARELGIIVRVLKQGEHFMLGRVWWETLAPPAAQPWTGRARNDDSLVLRLRYGRHAFLLTGDIDRRVERRLLDEGLVGSVDVLKVAHHGSRTGLLPEFLHQARPAVSIISAGAGNAYGLPNPATVEALRAEHALLLRTDLSGLVGVRSDGRYLTPGPRPSSWAWQPGWDLF